jgi:GDPmannose 4,6-dehydratase
MARALITGISGQDGSYLTELLLDQGYEIHGLVRHATRLEQSRLAHLCRDPAVCGQRLHLHRAELDDPTTLRRVLAKAQPDEVYHLAGQSHVGLSFEIPELTSQLTAMATIRLLELVRDLQPAPKFFHASSSEIFGQPRMVPQDETTPFAPVSPYGCAKAFATQMVGVYRSSYRLFASNGILFNHESPRRGEDFVTRKICRGAARIRLGLSKELVLGDLKSERDWGHARDYVKGMWLALQADMPEDFVFATGQLHSVQDVVEHAFATVQLDWAKYVRHDPRFSRPAEPRRLVGNSAKAKRLLHWEPRTTFAQLITEMTEAELAALS